MKGKILCQLSKIIAAVIVFAALVINAIAKTVVVPVDDAIKVGIFVFVVFLPIDVSIWIDIVKTCMRKTIPADGKDDEH
jgi:hypothetical protein